MKTHSITRLIPTIIAVDFDGTCVKHTYPDVGEEIGAAPVLRALTDAGHKLILWTMRSERQLVDAINWFQTWDIPLWGINKNPEQLSWTSSPKAYAHIYIDDAAFGAPLRGVNGEKPYIDWDVVRARLQHLGLINGLVQP